MESAQAGQDTAPDPTGESALGRVSRGGDADAWGRVEGHELVVEPVVETVEERGAAGDDDVGEEMRPDIGVDLAKGGLDEGRERLALWWGGIVGILGTGQLARFFSVTKKGQGSQCTVKAILASNIPSAARYRSAPNI